MPTRIQSQIGKKPGILREFKHGDEGCFDPSEERIQISYIYAGCDLRYNQG
jgi:hypothetical protein